MAAVGHFGCPKFTFDRISGHFRSIRNFFIFFTKWPTAPILDVRNSLLVAFLAISDRYVTLFCLDIFNKMAAVDHFGCLKFTFDRISGHFRSILNFYFFWIFLQNGRRRPFWMSEIHFHRISGHFRSIRNLIF